MRHGISGQLKCTLDRFYSAAYPGKPRNLKKAAMILSSGDPEMYDGAMFSYKGDFLEYLGLEDMGVFTDHGMENGSASKLKELRGAVFQASGNHRKPVPCFQGILPYTVGSLVIYTRERYDLPELSPVYARERQLNWKIFSLAGITGCTGCHQYNCLIGITPLAR